MSRSFNSRRGTGYVRYAPSRIRHEENEVPRRALEKMLLHKVLGLKDLEEAPLFPQGNRPKNHHHWL